MRRAILVVVAVAGCESSVAPPPPPPPVFSDVAAWGAATASLDSGITSPAMRSVAALAPRMTFSSTTSALFAPTLACASQAMPDAMAPPAITMNVIGIPDSMRGKVFALDAPYYNYHPTGDPGGPADGIRFPLYRVDTLGALLLPLSQFAWLDLTETPWGSGTLRTQVSDSAGIVVDYTMIPRGTQSADTSSLAGFIRAGSHKLGWSDSTAGFRLSLSASRTIGGLMVDSTTLLATHFQASTYATDPFDNNHALDLTLALGADTLRMSGNVFTYCLLPATDVSVTLNGAPFAHLVNGTTGVAVDSAGGTPPDSAQARILLGLLRSEQWLYRVLTALAMPGTRILSPP